MTTTIKENLHIQATPNSRVIKNLLHKRELLRNNDPEHQKYKTALIVGSGVMRGVYGMGATIGLEESGMSDAFDYVIGISAGAPTCAYFLAGQSKLGPSMYYKYLSDKKFIDYFRFSKILDIDYLELLLRSKNLLNTERIKKSRSKFLIAVTNAKTGEGKFIEACDDSVDIITAIKASIAIPIFYNKTVPINGEEYCDGSIGFPLPLEYAIKQLGCTNILMVRNHLCSYGGEPQVPLYEKILARLYLQSFSSMFREAFFSRHKRYSKAVDMLWENHDISSINIGIVCPNVLPIGELSRAGSKFEKIIQEAADQVSKLFRKP